MKTRFTFRFFVFFVIFASALKPVVAQTVVYTQGFDGVWSTTVTAFGWTASNTGTKAYHRDDCFTGWSANAGPGNHSGGHSAMVDNKDLGSGTVGYMTSANIDLSGVTCTSACGVQLSFYYKNLNNDGSLLEVDLSNNGGTSFPLFTQFPSNTGGWVLETVTIPSSYLVSTFQMAFTYKVGSGSANMGVDEVAITALSTRSSTWLTAGTTDWATASNWSLGVVPDICTNVTIPSGGNQPTIAASTTANCANLTINNSATLTVSSTANPFNIYGTVTNNGTLLANGSYYVILNGAAKTLGGTGTFTNFPLLVASGASYTLSSNITANDISIPSGGTLSLSSYTCTMVAGIYTPAFSQVGTLNLNTGTLVDIVDMNTGNSTLTPASLNHNTGTFTYDMSGSGGTNYYWLLQDNDMYNVVIKSAAGQTIKLGDVPAGGNVTSFDLGNSLTISSSSTFVDGTAASVPITLKGDWTNNGTFTTYDGNSIVSFTGTGAQAIKGSASTTFNKLTINNTSALTVGVTQNINTQVASLMTLTKGAYNLNTFTLTLQSSATTAISAGSANTAFVVSETPAASNTSYIDWQVGATNATYVFPFGVPATGNYIPFTFVKTAGTTTDLYVSTRGTAASDNLPFPAASDAGTVGAVTNLNGYAAGAVVNYAVTNVIDRWWDIYAPGGATANVTFSYQGVENATTTGATKAQHWSQNTTPDWDPPVGAGTGTITAGVGTCTVTGATTFSPWVLISNASVLPVEFVDVSTECTGNGTTQVKWSTATETNNSFFTVERSSDGNTFVEIGREAGAGTTSSLHSYTLEDKHPELPAYYRIKQTDFDGLSKYSDVMYANCAGPKLTFVLYPNPGTSGEATYIHFPDLKKNANLLVSVYNAIGELVYSKAKVMDQDAGDVVGIEAIEKMPAGIYLIKVQSDAQTFTSKLVIR